MTKQMIAQKAQIEAMLEEVRRYVQNDGDMDPDSTIELERFKNGKAVFAAYEPVKSVLSITDDAMQGYASDDILWLGYDGGNGVGRTLTWDEFAEQTDRMDGDYSRQPMSEHCPSSGEWTLRVYACDRLPFRMKHLIIRFTTGWLEVVNTPGKRHRELPKWEWRTIPAASFTETGPYGALLHDDF